MSHLGVSARGIKPRIDEYDRLEIGMQLFCKVEEFPDPIHYKPSSKVRCYRLTRYGLENPDALCCCLQITEMGHDDGLIEWLDATLKGKIMFFPGSWLNIVGTTCYHNNPIESWEFVILEQESTWLLDEYEGPVRRFVR